MVYVGILYGAMARGPPREPYHNHNNITLYQMRMDKRDGAAALRPHGGL